MVNITVPFARGIHHRWLVDSPHKEPVIWKVFSCHNFIIVILNLWPLLLTIFHQKSNMMENSFYSHPLITTKFCTWHNSCAVVTCAKLCCNMNTRNWITAKWILHRSWIVTEKIISKLVPRWTNSICYDPCLYIYIYIYMISTAIYDIQY